MSKTRIGRFTIKRSILFCCITLMALVGASPAKAVMVIDTWTATINWGFTGALSPGDEVSWTVTYDNESTNMHHWKDGLNGIAEGGAGDDLIDATFDIADYVSNWGYFADVELSTFGSVITQIGTDGAVLRDAAADNAHHRYQNLDNGFNYYEGLQDEYVYYFDVGPGGDHGYFRQYIEEPMGGGSDYLYTEFGAIGISTELAVAPVPEPSTILLLGSGLVGLALIRRKRIDQ